MKNKKIVLLNILDKELIVFLDNFYKENNIEKQSLIPHITLRGPFDYKNKVAQKTSKRLNDYIDLVKNNKEKLVIDGVDIFENDELYIVYLKIHDLNNLKFLSRKKDYPVSKYGFNPHITLFTTKDKKLAYKIKDKLNKKFMNISCKKVEWNIHELGTKNKSLFNLSTVI